MKKRAIVVLSAIALAGWMAGTGFSAVTVKSAPDGASSPATQATPPATPDYNQHGSYMMYGNHMHQGMHGAMMGAGMHGTMGIGNSDEGFSWQRMWDQCRQFWSGHDHTPDSGPSAGPRS